MGVLIEIFIIVLIRVDEPLFYYSNKKAREEKDDDTELRLESIKEQDREANRISPELEEVQEPQQQQLLDSDESNDDVPSEKVRSAITDISQWDKYNLDEYGGDQDEIEESVQGKPVHIYYSFY